MIRGLNYLHLDQFTRLQLPSPRLAAIIVIWFGLDRRVTWPEAVNTLLLQAQRTSVNMRFKCIYVYMSQGTAHCDHPNRMHIDPHRCDDNGSTWQEESSSSSSSLSLSKKKKTKKKKRISIITAKSNFYREMLGTPINMWCYSCG